MRSRALVKGVANGYSIPDILDSKIEKAFQAGKFDIIHVHHPMLIGRAADLFLFSSLSETQGIVLIEAMAAACPVLALKASGVCDVVVNGRNGYMTDVSEIEYEKQLAILLSQDREYLSQRRKNMKCWKLRNGRLFIII